MLPFKKTVYLRIGKRGITTKKTGDIFILISCITYIPTRTGWLYLAVVMDLFSRRIEGRTATCPATDFEQPYRSSAKWSCSRSYLDAGIYLVEEEQEKLI